MTPNRESWSLNCDWRFHLGDLAERNWECLHRNKFAAAEWLKAGNHGPSKVGYPDAAWRVVDLPHDFVIEGRADASANQVHGSLPVSVAWYRKQFALPAADAARRIWLEFDGVYRDASVWLNGQFVGRHLSGYTSFHFDVTELCEFGGDNALAVRVDATEFELWSYEGGGIYRDVRLVKTAPLRVAPWGVFVQAEPGGTVRVATTVQNDGQSAATGELRTEIWDGERLAAAASMPFTVDCGATATLAQATTLAAPRLWCPADPYRYRLRSTLCLDGQAVDAVETPFGVRSVRFDAQTGFHLNGQPLKLRGLCNHQDHAGVGVAIPDALQRWRLERLIEMGCNALRTAHNPPSPTLLDLCDELGLLVLDETRQVGTSREVLDQLDSLIRRDRNHPCVILWSIGNEEMLVQHTPRGIRQLRRMQDLVHRLDPSRPVTYAMNMEWLGIAAAHDQAGFRFDVFGANYRGMATADGYDQFHERYPDWPLLATEAGGSLATRGSYQADPAEAPCDNPAVGWRNPARQGVGSEYSETVVPWGASIEETWQDCATRPFLAGTFLWTGFDYRGETFPYEWPAVITRYGLLDLCGFPKDAAWYYRAWWTDQPVLHLFPHWNWPADRVTPVDVWCYSNCAAVELFLNGVSLGRQPVPHLGHVAWPVRYQPGQLEARGFDAAGKLMLTASRVTAGAPAGLTLTTSRQQLRADNEDVAVVNVAVVDSAGHLVPTATTEIPFTVSGPARIIGVGNGNPLSHEPDKADRRQAYAGLCQVLVQTTRQPGLITLRANAPTLAAAELKLESMAAPSRPWMPSTSKQPPSQPRLVNQVDGNL